MFTQPIDAPDSIRRGSWVFRERRVSPHDLANVGSLFIVDDEPLDRADVFLELLVEFLEDVSEFDATWMVCLNVDRPRNLLADEANSRRAARSQDWRCVVRRRKSLRFGSVKTRFRGRKSNVVVDARCVDGAVHGKEGVELRLKDG